MYARSIITTLITFTFELVDDVDFGGPSPLTAAFILSTGGLMDGASR